MNKIYLQTHGCTQNFSEGEIMKGLLSKAGFEVTNEVKESNIMILNSCTVKGENVAIRQINKLTGAYPDKKFILAGCITKELVHELRKVNEDASLINTHNVPKIVEVVEEVVNGNTIEAITLTREHKINLPKIRKNPVVGIVSILNSCNQNCTYCSVKLVKGALQSYPREEIIEEVKEAISDGCKEVWLTSQDNASYGTEKIWRSSLPELVKDVCDIKGDFKVRIGMMTPVNLKPILDDLIEVFKHEKVFKFLHLPVQSGNNEILTKMKRNYTIEEFTEQVHKFRREIPNITVSTDIIVGFPTETVEQFNDSLNLLKDLRFEVLNISRYQARPKTRAFYMEGEVAGGAIKDRSRIMTEIFHNISRMNNEKWLNWKGEVIIDERGKNDSWIGRNSCYKQIILHGNYKLGQKVKVHIENSSIFDLKGVAT